MGEFRDMGIPALVAKKIFCTRGFAACAGIPMSLNSTIQECLILVAQYENDPPNSSNYTQKKYSRNVRPHNQHRHQNHWLECCLRHLLAPSGPEKELKITIITNTWSKPTV
jgi:hypothetical protein